MDGKELLLTVKCAHFHSQTVSVYVGQFCRCNVCQHKICSVGKCPSCDDGDDRTVLDSAKYYLCLKDGNYYYCYSSPEPKGIVLEREENVLMKENDLSFLTGVSNEADNQGNVYDDFYEMWANGAAPYDDTDNAIIVADSALLTTLGKCFYPSTTAITSLANEEDFVSRLETDGYLSKFQYIKGYDTDTFEADNQSHAFPFGKYFLPKEDEFTVYPKGGITATTQNELTFMVHTTASSWYIKTEDFGDENLKYLFASITPSEGGSGTTYVHISLSDLSQFSDSYTASICAAYEGDESEGYAAHMSDWLIVNYPGTGTTPAPTTVTATTTYSYSSSEWDYYLTNGVSDGTGSATVPDALAAFLLPESAMSIEFGKNCYMEARFNDAAQELSMKATFRLVNVSTSASTTLGTFTFTPSSTSAGSTEKSTFTGGTYKFSSYPASGNYQIFVDVNWRVILENSDSNDIQLLFGLSDARTTSFKITYQAIS